MKNGHTSHSLNSVKEVYIGDFRGESYNSGLLRGIASNAWQCPEQRELGSHLFLAGAPNFVR